MREGIVYLDHAATSPVCAEVAEHLARDLVELGWNTGTRYELGLTARKALDVCREQVAHYLGCETDAVIFTSGGTESNNIGLRACCGQLPGGGVLWNSATTHPSLAGPVETLDSQWEVVPMPVGPWGAVDVDGLAELPTPDVVVLEWVNNEVGLVQPVDDIAAAAVAANPEVCILVDGAQGVGKLPLPDMASLTVFTFVGHKIAAPAGIGGMMLKPSLKLTPLTRGGGQERGWRPGTVPLPLIRAFCNALEHITALEAAPFGFESFDGGDVPAPIQDPGGSYSPCITLLNVAPVEGEVLQHHLEEAGIFLGTGSACSSAKKSLSPIHKAIGMDAKASRCTVRWSTFPGQDPAELDQAWRVLVKQWRELKRFF
ncbi:MAG: aminotransferase class V-fold PLP-dependent enzyme [Kiritimatiellia bacterium]|jgi:cysteine desulfurase|nr:aminotransferase class V-fold PLP-dependent enzyme [Kiritimatiellia bacterium]MDP6631720.1 aminotransferase class V-fold PLP-dependent enzyme [Kiritimatiellia bacterium]MDP6810528.1 aminotransferase class V-fold PLP-dependent enzyme [Kiritimatiellia bacterium]MDP7024956.1 aminotransferase class V-fold PLP-dependent enzyme [Kiritimatiellia bacterium]